MIRGVEVRSVREGLVMRTLVGLALAAGILAGAVRGAFAQQAGGKGKPPDPKALFKRIDTNGDGKLSREEFRAFIESHSGTKTHSPETIDRVFNRLDTNGDGFLSFEEFVKLRELRKLAAERAKAKKNQNAGTSR
jgi:calcium-binding protein CML